MQIPSTSHSRNSFIKLAKQCLISPLLLLVLVRVSGQESHVTMKGEMMKWHKITLIFEGPESSEMDEVNPFMDYRLDVNFSNGQKEYTVPGYFAADGNAAESSAIGGNKWVVNFTPDELGTWTYVCSFKKGKDVAVRYDMKGAESAGFMDGKQGEFNIIASDKTGLDNRSHGRLSYVGEHYLQYEESGKYFIKVGVDAPENLFAYEDFDATPNALGLRKAWEPHKRDLDDESSQYTWQNGKGGNLLGAIKYLADEGLNVFSFLTFNIDGDDRNVYPYILKASQEDYEEYASNKKNVKAWENYFYTTRLDISKLDQWERILSYAETRGMFLHFKTHETETDHLMDGGVFGRESKLYYRELVARFGHHLSMNWNLGEENNQPISEVIKAANYLYDLDPYKHHLVIHTFPNQDDRYAQLIGDQSPLTGASLQLREEDFTDVHPRVLKWRMKSDSTGKKWPLAVDEPGRATIALLPDDEDMEHNLARSNALWGTLMAGGFGVEWYFGYQSPNSDLTCEDFRSRDLFWDQNKHALDFFHKHISFWKMTSTDDLVSTKGAFCFANEGQEYAIYLHPGMKSTKIDLGSSGKNFQVFWYSPREGGELQTGSVKSVIANGLVDIGLAPKEQDEDWVVLLR